MSTTTTPATNVVPLPGTGPMLYPPPNPNYPAGHSPWPQPPSCFSQLSALNACYDSVQMMEQILAKVMTDLVTNNKAVQNAIVAAIAASGSNVPLIGVTNGSDAQPGQVGEFHAFTITVNFGTGTVQQTINMGTLQPGDWDVWAWAQPGIVAPSVVEDMSFYLFPQPAGFSNTLSGAIWDATSGGNLNVVVSSTCRASISAPVPLVFNFETITTGAGNATFQVEMRRAR
jgi:hypothetical protein